MSKRSTISLILISLITTILAVTGSSYAYYASSIEAKASSKDIAITKVPFFMSTSTGAININFEDYLVDSEEDLDGENAEEENKLPNDLNDSTSLSVYLTSAQDNELNTCTYDIILISNQKVEDYNKTINLPKDFKISSKGEGSQNIERDKLKVTTDGFNEKSIDELTWKEKEITIMEDGQEIKKLVKYAVLIDDAKISSIYSDNPTIVNWDFNVRFYNIKDNLNNIKDTSYSAIIKVDDDSIKC